MSRYRQLGVFKLSLVTVLLSVPVWAQHIAMGEAKNARGALMASLRPSQELLWKRVSPTPQQPDGPVLYQIIFRSSATPNVIPKISNNFTLTNSLLTDNGSQVAIGGLAIAADGTISFKSGQTFPLGAASGDVNGTYPSLTVTGLQGQAVAPAAPAAGQVLQWAGTQWAPATLPAAWLLAGTSGTGCTTSPCGSFLGTTDSASFEVRVSNQRAFRIEPATQNSNGAPSFAPNVIGGFAGNSVTGGAGGATIAGGGVVGEVNLVTDDFGTVGGGANNQAGNNAGTTSDRPYATVAGGHGNAATSVAATVAGGQGNIASGPESSVAGGNGNTASGLRSTVGGGDSNVANRTGSTVAGGLSNTASGIDSTVAGGILNTASGIASFAAGQHANTNNHTGAFVWGDVSASVDVLATADNQFVARAAGGFQFIAGVDGGGNPVAANTVSIAPGTGIMTFASGQSFPGTVTSVVGTNGLSASAGGGTVTVTSNATPTNTASTIVSRDGLGNFAAGTATLSGNLGLPTTTSASAGVLTMNTAPFLHAFGTSNTFLGILAGNLTLTGSANTAVGNGALTSETSGSNNTAVGFGALGSSTSAQGNSAFGRLALSANTTGAENAAFGSLALDANTTGGLNAAFGDLTLHSNTTGNQNSAFGFNALNANTIGNFNSAFGVSALQQNSTGVNNSGFGDQALLNNSAGSGNLALGPSALVNLLSGNSNIAIGTSAGVGLNAGESHDIYIANAGVAGESNTIRIGDGSFQTAAFIAGISGATSASGVQVFVNGSGQLGTTTSSRRFKQDIADLGGESDILMKLRPVAFYYKPELDSTHTRQYGLVAEEVAQIAPGLVVFDQDGRPQTVRYHFINAMLLNEVQKQRRLIEAQQRENAAQQKQLAAEQERIAAQQQQIDELRREMAGLLQRVAQIEQSGSQIAYLDHEK
jgi:hypothetical protein